LSRLLACVALVWVAHTIACGPYTEISRGGQRDTARVAQEIACRKHIERFRAGAAEGLSCEASKRRAAVENPLCNLSFECPSQDAGQDVGAE
jgi:hypothetical protein